jgi:hypothetical protein
MTKHAQHRFFAIIVACVLLAGSFVVSGCRADSALSCSVPPNPGETTRETLLRLRALSPAAKKGHITASGTTAWFVFDREELSSAISRNSSLDAIEVTLRSSVPVDVMLAPVFTGDLTKRGQLVARPAPRANALITGVSGTVTIRMRMILPDNSGNFTGFAVEALRSASSGGRGTELHDKTPYADITSVSLLRSETGWETRSDRYWAGFGREGGSRAYGGKGPVLIDRGEQAVFSFSASGEDIGTPLRPRRTAFSAGPVSFGWRFSPIPHSARVYAEQLEELPVHITPEMGTEHLDGLRVSASSLRDGVDSPIPLDPNAMITWPQSAWRNPERELFTWDRFPSILIFDTADYDVQSRYFKRLAFFVEKAGYTGQLMDDDAIAHLHGYNAHDYQAEGLAAFFDKAKRERFPLNRHEEELREILVDNGIIIAGDGGYLPGTGAVLSFSRESVSYLRYLFMAHEGFHGLYFTNTPFREEMHRLYTAMDRRAVDFLETYFTVVDSLGYDRSDRFLMENECMAYTLQQPLNRVSDYFSGIIRERFTRYGGSVELADYIEQSAAVDFVALGEDLETYVFTRWGLAGGRVGLWYSNRD